MKREAEFSSLSLDHLGFAGSEDRNSPPFFSSTLSRMLAVSSFPIFLFFRHMPRLFFSPPFLWQREADIQTRAGVAVSSCRQHFLRGRFPLPSPSPSTTCLPGDAQGIEGRSGGVAVSVRPSSRREKERGEDGGGLWSPLSFSSPTSDGRRRSRRPKLEGREEEVEGEQ